MQCSAKFTFCLIFHFLGVKMLVCVCENAGEWWQMRRVHVSLLHCAFTFCLICDDAVGGGGVPNAWPSVVWLGRCRIRIRIYILRPAQSALWAAALSAPPPETPPEGVSPRSHCQNPIQVFGFWLLIYQRAPHQSKSTAQTKWTVHCDAPEMCSVVRNVAMASACCHV